MSVDEAVLWERLAKYDGLLWSPIGWEHYSPAFCRSASSPAKFETLADRGWPVIHQLLQHHGDR